MRDDFYERMKLDRHVTESDFRDFAAAYTRSLNMSYVAPDSAMPAQDIERIIQGRYALLPAKAGLVKPTLDMTPKYLMFNELYSKVGVLGFMGPFFAEIHLNHDLLPVQRPFTYAHELAHRLSVSSEAEANFWAYDVCTRSSDAWIRYSGYMGIFPYVRAELRHRLSVAEYRLWLGSVRSEVLDEQSAKDRHWIRHYSTWLGALQHALYDGYLKSNKLPAGTRNYAQVIAMIICYRKAFPTSSGCPGAELHSYARELTVMSPRRCK